jgi:putative transposase
MSSSIRQTGGKSMPFWRCYYHIIWATKYREPSIIPAYEAVMFAAMERTSAELECDLLAANCTTDHVHITASIKPSITVAKYIGRMKGASSRAINTSFERETRFHWQNGYSVLTCGKNALPFIKKYIAKQKEHHANNTAHDYLEYLENS